MCKINIITLGCSKNSCDSEKIAGSLAAQNMDVSHLGDSSKSSGTVLVNTCGFIGDAKEQSINVILEQVERKRQGAVERLFVMGCLAQRYRCELMEEIPEIDGIFGVNERDEIIRALGGDKIADETRRLLSTPKHYAYLKISEGCNRRCSFCAIPLIRGKQVSTPIESLVREAGMLADGGVKELILIAQDLSAYGTDIYKEQRLGDLIRELVKIEGIEWIRLHYLYPENFPVDVMELIASEPKICKYVDIPLQHNSERILKSMRRGASGKKTDDLLSELRKKVPGIAIRTTLIAGYPGETIEEFEKLKSWVERQKFDRLGVFAYSGEEGTAAALLDDDVSPEEKQRRVAEIMSLQQEISLNKNEALTGKKLRAIIDGEDEDFFTGRTEYDSPEVDCDVFIDKSQYKVPVGQCVNIVPTSCGVYDIFATPVP